MVTGSGLLVSILSLFGVFSSRERIAFFQRIFRTQESILRDSGVFEEFLKSFPPSNPSATVTRIMPRRFDSSNDGRDCFSSVYYEENGLPGKQAVASESEVKAWAYRTPATIIGVAVASIGFIIQALEYLFG